MDKDKLILYLLEKVEILTNRLESAEKEIAELKMRLNSNSSNSSKPPSSDGLKEASFTKKGKQGGQ